MIIALARFRQAEPCPESASAVGATVSPRRLGLPQQSTVDWPPSRRRNCRTDGEGAAPARAECMPLPTSLDIEATAYGLSCCSRDPACFASATFPGTAVEGEPRNSLGQEAERDGPLDGLPGRGCGLGQRRGPCLLAGGLDLPIIPRACPTPHGPERVPGDVCATSWPFASTRRPTLQHVRGRYG